MERLGSPPDSCSTEIRLPRQSHQHDHRSWLRFKSDASVEVTFGEGLIYSTATVVVVWLFSKECLDVGAIDGWRWWPFPLRRCDDRRCLLPLYHYLLDFIQSV